MKIKTLKQKVWLVGAVGIGVLLFLFVATCFSIGKGIKSQCQEAKKQYEGDCVEVLVGLLNDEKQGFKARNSAIWALGQLGDSRALPVLKSYYTGNIPEREPLNETISQYELKKAVNLTSGGVNISAFIWRGVFNKK